MSCCWVLCCSSSSKKQKSKQRRIDLTNALIEQYDEDSSSSDNNNNNDNNNNSTTQAGYFGFSGDLLEGSSNATSLGHERSNSSGVADSSEESLEQSLLFFQQQQQQRQRLSMSDAIQNGFKNQGDKFEDLYTLKEPLGRGSTSTCYVCVHKRSGSQLAAKMIDKRKISMMFSDLLPQFRREVEVLRMLNHPHIIKLYEVFETKENIIVIMELVLGGELFDYLVERPDRLLSEAEASHIIRQVTWAIAYMHQHGVMHRDIKLENILVSRRPTDEEEFPTVKIIDFGLAKRFDPALRKSNGGGDQAGASMAHTFFGTIGYLAPEMLKRNGYTPAVDNWALGVLMYVLLCGIFPFDDEAQRNSRIKADYKLKFPPWARVSEPAKDVLSKLLEVNPSKRMSAAQALRHPWIGGEAASRNAVLDTPKLLSHLATTQNSGTGSQNKRIQAFRANSTDNIATTSVEELKLQ